MDLNALGIIVCGLVSAEIAGFWCGYRALKNVKLGDKRWEFFNERESALDEREEELMERKKFLDEMQSELRNRKFLLDGMQEEIEEREEVLDEREKELEEKRYERIRKIANRPRNTPHPSANADTFSTREKALPPTTQGEWSGVPLAERGICKNCVYHEIGCFECELSCEDALERFKGSGWSEDVIKRSDLSREWCAVKTGICAYYREDESDIVFCKDCKYGVKMDEPDENRLEWNCTKGMIGATWSRIGECCPCGERKEEGGNEE